MSENDGTPSQSGKRTIVTVRLEAKDADRLEQAIKSGKLADLGIVSIQRADYTHVKQWTANERDKRTR